MNGIVQSLTSWLFEHTYAVVFVATLVDATAIPFPGRIILAAAGALAATGDASLTLLIAMGAAGVVITDHLWYFAGSLGAEPLEPVARALNAAGRAERQPAVEP